MLATAEETRKVLLSCAVERLRVGHLTRRGDGGRRDAT